ncbi:hypothetical protein [Sorangium sp. So ce1024]
MALFSPVLGCGSDADVPADDAAGASSSSGGSATSGGGSATSGGGSATSGGATTTSSSASGGGTTEPFSFFVTSLAAMRELSNSQDGFGGDLRFGETGPGAGLRGADKICATIAEKSLPGAGSKTWRAFLSAAAGEDGKQVDAIDRIGDGPWYDRLGRLVANNKQELLGDRPSGADAAIANDLPNEDGVPNHQPDPSQPEVDNHDTLTGSDTQGRLFDATATCNDWTSASGDSASGRPRLGHSWPRGSFGGGGPGGPGGPGFPGGPGGMSGSNWMSAHDAPGCAPGVNLVEMGPAPRGSTTVGSGGGYGGIYCFALTP